jgi:hypothetical protein
VEFTLKDAWSKNSEIARKSPTADSDWFHSDHPPTRHGVITAGKPGDVVLLQAKILEVYPGELGYRIVLFSKTDQYECFIRPDHVVRVILAPEVPAEPSVGTWIAAMEENGEINVFAHLSSESGGWLDVATQAPIHWSEVYRRGGHPDNVLSAPAPR